MRYVKLCSHMGYKCAAINIVLTNKGVLAHDVDTDRLTSVFLRICGKENLFVPSGG